MLVVIDDVWKAADLEPFLVEARRCAWLVTTRNWETLPVGTIEVRVDAMKTKKAVRLLQWGLPPHDEEPFAALVRRLGKWPLALKLVNGALRQRIRRRESIKNALEHAERILDERGLTGFDARNASQRREAVAKTAGVSLDLLAGDEWKRLLELAVFPQDENIPISAVEVLRRQTAGWSELQTEELLSRLFDRSLLLDLDLTSRRVRSRVLAALRGDSKGTRRLRSFPWSFEAVEPPCTRFCAQRRWRPRTRSKPRAKLVK